jgi:hypothetical protein
MHFTLGKLFGQGPIIIGIGSRNDGGIHFRQFEAPDFASAAEQRMGRNLSATRKLQDLTALNVQESCHSVGINKRLGL